MFWAADLHRPILDTFPLSANSLNLYPVFGEMWKIIGWHAPRHLGLAPPQEKPRSATGAVKMFITDTMFTFNGHGDGDE